MYVFLEIGLWLLLITLSILSQLRIIDPITANNFGAIPLSVYYFFFSVCILNTRSFKLTINKQTIGRNVIIGFWYAIVVRTTFYGYLTTMPNFQAVLYCILFFHTIFCLVIFFNKHRLPEFDLIKKRNRLFYILQILLITVIYINTHINPNKNFSAKATALQDSTNNILMAIEKGDAIGYFSTTYFDTASLSVNLNHLKNDCHFSYDNVHFIDKAYEAEVKDFNTRSVVFKYIGKTTCGWCYFTFSYRFGDLDYLYDFKIEIKNTK